MGLQGPAGKHGKQSPAHSTWFSSFSQSSCLLGTFSRFPAICHGLFCCLKPSWCSSMFPLAPQGLALHFRGKIEALRQGFSHSLTPKLLNLHLFFFHLLHSPSTWVMLALPPENGWFSFPSSQGLFLFIIFFSHALAGSMHPDKTKLKYL